MAIVISFTNFKKSEMIYIQLLNYMIKKNYNNFPISRLI